MSGRPSKWCVSFWRPFKTTVEVPLRQTNVCVLGFLSWPNFFPCSSNGCQSGFFYICFWFPLETKPTRFPKKTVLLLATIGNQGFVPLGLTCLFLLLPCLVAKRSGGETHIMSVSFCRWDAPKNQIRGSHVNIEAPSVNIRDPPPKKTCGVFFWISL